MGPESSGVCPAAGPRGAEKRLVLRAVFLVQSFDLAEASGAVFTEIVAIPRMQNRTRRESGQNADFVFTDTPNT